MSLPIDHRDSAGHSQPLTWLITPLTRLLYRRTVLLLAIFLAISVAAALWNMDNLSTSLIKSQALQNVQLYAQAIQEARSLYSADVVNVLEVRQGSITALNEQEKPGEIPLPVTFLMHLGHRLEAKNPGMAVRIYSNYPFPWRKAKGGSQDRFEQDAIHYLTAHPQEIFVRVEPFRGNLSLRYAQADVMKASCINCHNTHPDSPKTDWQVGDVRGVLTISTPLESFMKQVDRGLQSTSMLLGLLALTGLLAIMVVIGRLRQVARELEHRVQERTIDLQESNAMLSAEQEKAEQLLLNILPEPIAKQLKNGKSNIADGFTDATILFADIVNFTQLSQQISPIKLVGLLNQIFSEFDRLTETHGLEKIKTIGDAYMVVGGIPNPRPDHAAAIANMALDMQQVIQRLGKRLNYPLAIRIGINSGPVVAGVIGTKKFIYDLWGDAVNTASRMESHGIVGGIQVSQTTFDLLKDHYWLESRGLIPIKGKGDMATYLLMGLRRPLSTLEH